MAGDLFQYLLEETEQRPMTVSELNAEVRGVLDALLAAPDAVGLAQTTTVIWKRTVISLVQTPQHQQTLLQVVRHAHVACAVPPPQHRRPCV